jgi:hypothetical protein
VPVTFPTKLDSVTTPTLRLGLPDNPKEVVANDAVDAVPVTLPTKLDAVTIPLIVTLPLLDTVTPVPIVVGDVAEPIPDVKFATSDALVIFFFF